MNRHANCGFTLIELVSVIVILGVLAATALPNFTGIQSDARAATVKALARSMQTALATSRSLCALQTSTCDATLSHNDSPIPTVTISGTVSYMNYGYPSPWAGMDLFLSSYDGFTRASYVFNSMQAVYARTDAPTPSNCSVTYQSPFNSTMAPTITSVTTGC